MSTNITPKEVWREMFHRMMRSFLRWCRSNDAFETLVIISCVVFIVGFISLISIMMLNSERSSSISLTIPWLMMLIPAVSWSIFGLQSWYKSTRDRLKEVYRLEEIQDNR